MADDDNVKKVLSDISRHSGMGDKYTGMQDLWTGVNHRGAGLPLAPNVDHFGITLLTRPNLNLSYHNCLADSRLHPYLSDDRKGLKRAVRALLSIWCNNGFSLGDRFRTKLEEIDSLLVDSSDVFAPVLSNNLVAMSGWRDMVFDTYTSPEGIMREQFSMIDSPSKDYTAFDLSATFRNIVGDPITLIFFLWTIYAANVYGDKMVPFPLYILKNRIDYNTRIFRFLLDPSRTYITKVASTVGFPTTNPMGSHFNFDSQRPMVEENSQITINFRCMGTEYNEPKIIHEFNRLAGVLNPNMRPSTDDPQSPLRGLLNGAIRKIPTAELSYYNFKGKPFINPETMELEWYVSKEDIKQSILSPTNTGA